MHNYIILYKIQRLNSIISPEASIFCHHPLNLIPVVHSFRKISSGLNSQKLKYLEQVCYSNAHSMVSHYLCK